MKTLNFIRFGALLLAGAFLFSCAKDPVADKTDGAVPATRAVVGSTVSNISDVQRIGGVDLWNTNPLNAGTYYINDNIPFYNVVIINQILIREYPGRHSDLGWNDYTTAVLANPAKYIQPLRDKGIKVLLSVTGTQVTGWGFANMSDEDANRITDDLAAMMDTYGFDGVSLADEWTDYGSNYSPQPNPRSFSYFITKLRAKIGPGKTILLKDTGNTSTLTAEAVACIDCAWTSIYAYPLTQSYIPNLSEEKWAGLLYDAGSANSSRVVQLYVTKMLNSGSRSFVFDRLVTDYSPLKLFQDFATAVYGGDVIVSHNGETYAKEW